MSTETSVPPPRAEGLDASDAALLDTLLREAPIGFAFFDTSLRFRRINQTLADLHGVGAAAHIGRRPSEVWSAEIAEPVEAVLGEVLDTDRALLDADQRVAPADDGEGDGRHWAFSSFPAHSADGKINGIALIAVDVNDRQLAEEEVRRSEERYRSLVQASSALVWVARPDGRIYEDSSEWRAITGQTLDEYLGDGWLDALHDDDREKTEAAWRKAVTERSVFQMTFRVRTRSGGFRTMDSRAVPIVRHDETVEWVGTHTDISSQREADEMRHRLTEQLSAAALRTARLQQATSMLAEALTVEQVVQVIMEVGRSAIGADRSEVALLDGDRRELRLVNAGEPGTASRGDLVSLEKPSVLSLAVRERKPFLAETPDMLRIQLRTPDIDVFLDDTDERAWVGLPLLAAGNTIGALRFAFTRHRQITEEEKVFLEALAGQCALAVERATLFEREHTTAEVLQRSLLPERLPEVPGIALHAQYLPGTKNVQVGGDWYDGIPLADGRFGVVVGDVVGKGLTAAAGMSRVRNGLRALALTDPRPKAVLDGLDRLFSVTEADEQVTTLAYLVIDPVTGNGVLGNAGHLPPLLIGPGVEPKLVYTEPGTPLGWPTPRSQHPFNVPPGNTAVLYSDGLVENHRRKLSDGLDDLLAAAAEAPDDVIASPERILDYLVENMLAGYEQDDDVTVLAIRVVPREP
ncbi:MAG TPA: SpoIIE family protein phosphatase [Streptosporangiaceae bacterium]